jgi:dethiobiotin synthetase
MTLPLVRSFMVVGTDAGVGKTFVTSAIVQALGNVGVHAIAMQPVARGLIRDNRIWHGTELQQLAAVSAFGLPPRVLSPYILPPAGAPLERGAAGGEELTLDVIVDTFRILSTWGDVVVVEGVDDLRASLALTFDSADLARELKLPFVMVAGLRAGCVGPALASAQAMISRGLECAGWIANRLDPALADADPIVNALTEAMPGPCLGSIPRLAVSAPADAAQAIDIERTLLALSPPAMAADRDT